MCKACSFNPLSFQPSETTGLESGRGGNGPGTTGYIGATGVSSVDALLQGSKWTSAEITFSFPTLTSQYEGGYLETTQNFAPVDASIQNATRYAMSLLSQYTNLATREVNPVSAVADIRVAKSDYDNPTALGYFPSPGNGNLAGDIWFGTSYFAGQTATKGNYTWATTIHELGHALGLKHSHDVGGVAGIALNSQYDHMAYSIMSYRSYMGASTSGGYLNEQFGYAQTFMMYDIAALQAMYGANFNTNSGNTTYSWSPTTGEMFINSVGQGAPGGNRIFMTLWDGNGIDTYDFSNYATNLNVDLRPGAYSVLSSVQIANLGNGNYAAGNLYNALQYNGDIRSLIENAVGGSGNDTITGNATNNTLSGGWGNDVLVGDGPVSWDTAAEAIRRLYLATLDRAPDDVGHSGWTGALLSGQSLQSIATGFINSTEFTNRYGALNNEQFVTLLYRNVLGRDPDAGGLSGWVGALNSGQSREFVVTGFSDSTEFQVKTDIREHAGQVFRLYDTCFNRAPDTGGFWWWIDARYGNTQLKTMVSQFMNSIEFTNTYGQINNLSNAQFVELLYNNALNRPSEPAGAAYWIQVLASGQMTRADVLLSFSDSSEHINLVNVGLQTFMRNDTTGRHDTLYGGAGNDKLTGRFGSDLFRFNAADGGTDTIYGFEVSDRLQFTGFGFTNANQALAEMTQQGEHVVFVHNSNSVVFANTQLSVLQSLTSSGWLFA